MRFRAPVRRLARLAAPTRSPVRPAIGPALVAGALAVVAARPATRVPFRAARQARYDRFYGALAMPVGRHYASWDDEIADLFETIGKLQEAALLPAVGQDLDEINALISRLPAELQETRQRGYVHQAQLEQKVHGLVGRWDQLYAGLADALYRQQTELVEAANRLLDTVDRLYDPGADRGTVDTCWAGVRALQSRIEAAHKSLTGMYDDLGRELELVDLETDRLDWTLDQFEAAQFRLIQGEAPLRAASARWIRRGTEGPTGILYLTDQRILFEQKEEVVTVKFLFITVKKEPVHEFQLEVPVSAVEEVRAGEQKEGLRKLEKAHLLEMRFDHTAPLDGGLFYLLKDEAQAWQNLIGRVRSGDMDRERTAAAAEEAAALAQARSEIPSNCPNCSAPLDQTVLRGMTSIACRFCGTVIRI